MFDEIDPPKPRVRDLDSTHCSKPRKQSAKTLARHAAKRAKNIAEQELKREQNRFLNIKRKVERKKKALALAEQIVDNKATIIDTASIIETPPKVREELLNRKIIFEPNPGPQTLFLAASEKEVFYGGARGGGKSYSLLVDPLRYCNKEQHSALILRRTMPELRDLINHSQKLYKKAFPDAKWNEQEKIWKFPSGARIEFGYAETRQDALRYQGRSYTWIGVDELPQYPTPDIWNDLRGSLRSVDTSFPTFMRATGNPGNVGSQWVKELFIDPGKTGEKFDVKITLPNGKNSVITRRFIKAKLADNPYLMQDDSYMTALASLPEIQRRQWLEGDWDIWDGAAFPEFRVEIHVTDSFEVPKTWIRFRACDWGYSSAAVCLWFAVDYDNNLWVYRELKTKQTTADRFAQKIAELEKGEKIQYGVLDSSVWSKRGDIGPSVVETMQKEGVRWRPSDRSPSSRRNGKMEVHKRLSINTFTKQPQLKIFSNCSNIIKELPVLPLDPNDPEDVDTKANDHSYDALRYGCMSRPLSPSKVDWMARQIQQEKYLPSDPMFGY